MSYIFLSVGFFLFGAVHFALHWASPAVAIFASQDRDRCPILFNGCIMFLNTGVQGSLNLSPDSPAAGILTRGPLLAMSKLRWVSEE